MTKTPKYPTNTRRDAYMSCSTVLSTAIYPPPLTFIHTMCIYLPAAVCTALRAVSVCGDTASGEGKHILFAFSLNHSNN